MEFKQCILWINNDMFYIPKRFIVNLPYFKAMYSGSFYEKLEETDYKTMKEYKLDNFPIFCQNYTDHFSRIFNTQVSCKAPVDVVIQLLRIFDYIGFNVFKMGDHVKIELDRSIYLNIDNLSSELYEYDVEFTDEERKMILRCSNPFENNFKDNVEYLYPGYIERFNEINDIFQANFNHKVKFTYDTAEYIFTGERFYNIIFFSADDEFKEQNNNIVMSTSSYEQNGDYLCKSYPKNRLCFIETSVGTVCDLDMVSNLEKLDQNCISLSSFINFIDRSRRYTIK